MLYCCALNLDAHHNLNAWNRLQVLANMFLTFTQLVYFHVKIILGGASPSIRHIQLLLPKTGVHCFPLGLMFREISITLIRYSNL